MHCIMLLPREGRKKWIVQKTCTIRINLQTSAYTASPSQTHQSCVQKTSLSNLRANLYGSYLQKCLRHVGKTGDQLVVKCQRFEAKAPPVRRSVLGWGQTQQPVLTRAARSVGIGSPRNVLPDQYIGSTRCFTWRVRVGIRASASWLSINDA